MKAFSRVVIVALIIENISEDVVLAESKRLVLARRIHDPQNHIAIVFKQWECGEKVGERARNECTPSAYSKRCV